MSGVFTTAIEYPESDGRPMGETDLHRDAMVRHIDILKQYYRGQDVYVSGDLLVYYEEGNPKKFVVPDAFIAKGLKQFRRRTFRLWDEGITPQLVIETTSKKTKNRDLKVKPEIFAHIGIKEYFMFDPTCDYLKPPLKGYRLVEGKYLPIKQDSEGALLSEELGLRLKFHEGELAFIRPDTGEQLLSAEELLLVEAEAHQREAKAHQREAEARQREAAGRLKAENEVAELRTQLLKLKNEK